MESHVRTLAQAQAALGVEVQVYCLNHHRETTAFEADGPVAVARFRTAAAVAKLDFSPDLVRALGRLAVDVLHLHVPNPTMILALLAARPTAPVVVTYHSDIIRQRFRKLLFRPFERLAYRRVRAVLPTSPGYAAGSRFLRSYADRVTVLPHGIDLEPYLDPAPEHRAAAERLRARFGAPLWLFCGRMIYYKGLTIALRALAETPGTLVLIGDGPERPALQAEARRLGVADRAVFVGFLPSVLDIIPYYLAADAFWFPSNARTEAFGLVQVEAMACGCPVVNTAIPHSGVPWVSPHEETGLTVPPNDPAAFAAAARRLLAEPGLRTRLAAAARHRAAAEFDHRLMAERSLAIYRRVLAPPAVGRQPWTVGSGQWAVDGG
jgi:rhamnosyl/mannosyltransferase